MYNAFLEGRAERDPIEFWYVPISILTAVLFFLVTFHRELQYVVSHTQPIDSFLSPTPM